MEPESRQEEQKQQSYFESGHNSMQQITTNAFYFNNLLRQHQHLKSQQLGLIDLQEKVQQDIVKFEIRLAEQE